MRNVSAERTLTAPTTDVWAVLADYPNISNWNEAMTQSLALGDATEGVGAARECQFGSKGSIKMRETVTEWVPQQKMVIAVDKVEKQLIKSASMTITLSEDGGATPFAMVYDYEPKGGPLALAYGPILDRVFKKGFHAFMNDLETAAHGRASR